MCIETYVGLQISEKNLKCEIETMREEFKTDPVGFQISEKNLKCEIETSLVGAGSVSGSSDQ